MSTFFSGFIGAVLADFDEVKACENASVVIGQSKESVEIRGGLE